MPAQRRATKKRGPTANPPPPIEQTTGEPTVGGKNTFHNSTSTRQWRNLNDIPEDVQYEIHNYLPPEQRAQTLRSLSTTARSLRSAAQNTLLRKVRIELDKPLKGSINVLLCDAIHFLELTGFCRDGAKLSHIMKLLPEMTKLRTLRIHQVNLSKVFIQAFLETAANIPIPLRVEFEHNRYPTHLVVPKALCISDLRFSYVQTDSLKFWRSVLRASASTLQELHVCAADEVRLTEEERIDLPVLRVLYLAIKDGRDAPAFITPNKTITKLGLIGLEDWPSPSHLQSSVLPHLRELIAPLQVVNQLVPGRPVEAIEVTRFNRFPDGENWVGEKLGQVRKLQLHAPLSPRMAEQIETRFPSLESLWVKVFDRDLLEVVKILASFKCLTHLHIRLCDFGALPRYSVKDIATKLRKANSCFSSIEITQFRPGSKSPGYVEKNYEHVLTQ